jgi:hypothetical protein
MDNGNLSQKIENHRLNKTKFEEIDIWKVLISSLVCFKELHSLKILHKDFSVIL